MTRQNPKSSDQVTISITPSPGANRLPLYFGNATIIIIAKKMGTIKGRRVRYYFCAGGVVGKA